MNPFHDWGFREDPFKTVPLPGNEIGTELLVGREAELSALLRRLTSASKMPTLEGVNGIGKTSLANVAAYSAFQQHVTTGQGPLLLPCDIKFQPLVGDHPSVDEFLDKVYAGVAQTLLNKQKLLGEMGLKLPGTGPVDRWLNSAETLSMQATLGFVGLGAAREPFSPVYERNGLRRQVHQWLEHIFPHEDAGGIVCIIDNMELLRTSVDARRFVDELRDPLREIPGVRWVLCGSHGLVEGVAKSTRFDRRVFAPIKLGAIDPESALRILTTRVAVYSIPGQKTYLPFSGAEFAMLYKLLGGNPGDLMSTINEYCMWVADHNRPEARPTNYKDLFNIWLRETCSNHYRNIAKSLDSNAWAVFDAIPRAGGRLHIHDFLRSDVNRLAALNRGIQSLLTAYLISDGEKDFDNSTAAYYMTARGWMVHFARRFIFQSSGNRPRTGENKILQPS